MNLFARLAIAAIALVLASAALARDASERRAFQREQPCPSTGKRSGACPGWQVDHRIPLKCGGADLPSNMQWLTVEAHKAKTRSEARWCRKPAHR